jgi:hypothetical protein
VRRNIIRGRTRWASAQVCSAIVPSPAGGALPASPTTYTISRAVPMIQQIPHTKAGKIVHNKLHEGIEA